MTPNTEAIIRRWRKLGLIGDKPSAIEIEMAYEATLAIRMQNEKEEQYNISWTLVIVIALSCLALIIFLFSTY